MARGCRQSYCRVCHAAYRREHYLANREKYIELEVERLGRRGRENRSRLMDYLTRHGCVDCGETDLVVLEFDHRDPSTKTFAIGSAVLRKAWTTVVREIEKCDVRCANCHQQRTARQFGWLKIRADVPFSLSALDPGVFQASLIVDASEPGPHQTCTKCGRSLPLRAFHFRNTTKQKRRNHCRECALAYGREHYRRNRVYYLQRPRRRSAVKRSSQGLRLIAYLRQHPCVDCGATDPVILHFDHRDGSGKVATVGDLAHGRKWIEVSTEIAKCDVRCANCHRRRTAKQFKWTKFMLATA